MLAKIKHIIVVSVSTLGSRILGLVRDIVFFAYMGASGIGSAFLFAFTVPNLFRRLFGEGALSSAFIPLYTAKNEEEGKEGAYRFLNQVVSWVGLVLIGCTVLICLAWYGLKQMDQLPERWGQAAEYGIVLMPYMVLICVCALMSGAVNVVGKFGAVALSQVWLNMIMIGAMVFGGYVYGGGTQGQLWVLCGGVLVGGVVQMGVPMWVLGRRGYRYEVDFGRSEVLSRMLRILVPGLFSAAVFQVNVVVSRMLAFSLSDEAVSVLYLCNRFLELPIGLFTMAVLTVVFPALSKAIVSGDEEMVGRNYNRGLKMVMGLTVPAAVGLWVLAEPMLDLLFNYGAFDGGDVMMSAGVLQVFAVGLPLYSWGAISTRGFHAMGDMKVPFYVALVVFVLNTVLSLVWMGEYGVEGLAWANVVAGLVQAVGLQVLLSNKREAFGVRGVWGSLLKMGVGAGVMGWVVRWLGEEYLVGVGGKVELGFILGMVIGVGVLVYFGLLWVMGYKKNP